MTDTTSRIDTAGGHLGSVRYSHASGCRCWSVDGREYIDLSCGQGPIVLGHAYPPVVTAVADQLARGILLPGPPPAFYRLRDLLVDLYPHADDMLTFKTGSEAISAAIRLARAATSRRTVLRVGFHGWHDQVISPYVRCHSYDESGFAESWPPGVPHELLGDLVHIWHGGDPMELVRLVSTVDPDLAAVVIDPVQVRPDNARAAFAALRRAADEHGWVLILDESKTGLRVDLGGVQALYGVRADLTILGKALANGMPLAVLLGLQPLIDLAGPARIKGTFGLEAAALAAAVTTVETLRAHDGPRGLAERGTYLLRGLADEILATGTAPDVQAVPYHWPCMPYVHFGAGAQEYRDGFYAGMLDRGVILLREHMSYVSLAMTTEDLDLVVRAAGGTFRHLMALRPA